MPRRDTVVGLERGTVRLATYSPAWRILFEREKRTLLVALREMTPVIAHIGSTSIENMEAKPIIDMAVVVPSLADVEKCVQPLAAIGYEYKGEYGLSGRHFFTKGNPHTHYLHMVEKGSHHWAAWLTFRDYLIKRSDIAGEYRRLKSELAKKHESDRDSYTKAKSEFIAKVLEQARAEGFSA